MNKQLQAFTPKVVKFAFREKFPASNSRTPTGKCEEPINPVISKYEKPVIKGEENIEISESESVVSSDDNEGKNIPTQNFVATLKAKLNIPCKEDADCTFSFSNRIPFESHQKDAVQTEKNKGLVNDGVKKVEPIEKEKQAKVVKRTQRVGLQKECIRKLIDLRKKIITRKVMRKWLQLKTPYIKQSKEDILDKYMDHCATLIQKHFKKYEAIKRYCQLLASAKKFRALRKALIRGWKTRRVLACKKVQVVTETIGKLIKSIPLLQTRQDQYSKTMLLTLENQRKKKTEDFIRLVHILYVTGEWVRTYPKTIRKRKKVSILCLEDKTHKEITQKPSLRTTAEFGKDLKIVQPTIEEVNRTPKAFDIGKMSEYPTDEQYVPKKHVKTNFLKRKQVYDPRKAIAQAKYKEKSDTQNNVMSLHILGKPGTKEGVVKKNEKEIKECIEDIQEPKSPRPFLKRKSKRVEIMKVNWDKVGRRVDCWNSPLKTVRTGRKSPDLSPSNAVTKLQIPPNRALKRMRSAGCKQTKQRDIQKPLYKQITLHKNPGTKMGAIELQALYLQYHKAATDTYSKGAKGSKIPIIRPNSRFLRFYNDDHYEDMLNRLKEEYLALSGKSDEDC